ncbi:MAG: hypothetical protein K2G36_10055 [Ruminococcus sp.]|nr:hypothetical protein [Ruminococcus sp.]
MTQKEHYRIRNEIEDTVKEENINRRKFHEVSKFSYENILRKFYYTFFEHNEKIDLSYAWLRLRKSLKNSDIVRLKYDDTDIDSMKSLIPDYSDDKKCYGIVADGWVYEGEISEILTAFSEIYFVTDFYIVSKKFDWVVVNCEDGECIWRVSSEKY